MNPILQVQFRDLTPSPAITTRIEQEFRKLLRHHGSVQRFRATISAPDHHHQHGRHFRLRLEVELPGLTVVTDHKPPARRPVAETEAGRRAKSTELEADHKDAYVAIRDTFAVAHRRLDEHVRKTRTQRHRRADAVAKD